VAPTQIPSVGLFSKVDIDLNALSKQLPSSDADFDVRSTITSKSMKGLNLSKKEKRKLKREFLTKSRPTLSTSVCHNSWCLSYLKLTSKLQTFVIRNNVIDGTAEICSLDS